MAISPLSIPSMPQPTNPDPATDPSPSRTTTPTSIAIIGTGLIGKRHLAHVLSEPLTRLAAIVEPLPVGNELAAARGVPCFASVAELIAARDAGELRVDAAIVGTPTHTHVPIGVQLIDAGLHALVEKPVAGTAAEAQRLVDAVERAGGRAKVLVGQHRRFNPYTVALKAALDSGRLGTVLGVQGVWAVRKGGEGYFEDWKIRPEGGGVVNINLIHDIDLLRYLLGDITRVYCEEGTRTRGHPVEETGALVLRFASGAVGTFFFSDAAASPWCWEGATGENPDLVGHYAHDIYTLLDTRGSIQLPSLALFTFDHLPRPERDGHWRARLSQDVSFRLSEGAERRSRTRDDDGSMDLMPRDDDGGADPNPDTDTDTDTDTPDLDSTADPTPQDGGGGIGLKPDAGTPPFTLQLRHFVRVCQGREEPSCSAREGMRSVRALEVVRVSMVEGRVVDVRE